LESTQANFARSEAVSRVIVRTLLRLFTDAAVEGRRDQPLGSTEMKRTNPP
jgi:hypothetical protein